MDERPLLEVSAAAAASGEAEVHCTQRDVEGLRQWMLLMRREGSKHPEEELRCVFFLEFCRLQEDGSEVPEKMKTPAFSRMKFLLFYSLSRGSSNYPISPPFWKLEG
ncbi:hypothetical protein MLD38_011474 [Melastoma candidum]|uniref:Uncharacterized protein n=1 Tax=Melastoma candidum TaxID=119954 RepID=A0ACB9R667_9MYRT|nr:hypothetical protein MLD38_011474 [Melastoma candidum]